MDRQSSKELLMTSDRLIFAFLIIIALWLCQEKGVADDSFCIAVFLFKQVNEYEMSESPKDYDYPNAGMRRGKREQGKLVHFLFHRNPITV